MISWSRCRCGLGSGVHVRPDDLNPLKDGDQEAQRNGADKLAVLGHDVSLYEIPPRNGYQEKLRTRRDNTALGVNSVLHNHWSETAKEAAKALEASAAVYPTVIGRSTHLHPSESLGLGPSDALSVGLAISAPSAPAEPCLAGGGAPSPLGGGAG